MHKQKDDGDMNEESFSSSDSEDNECSSSNEDELFDETEDEMVLRKKSKLKIYAWDSRTL